MTFCNQPAEKLEHPPIAFVDNNSTANGAFSPRLSGTGSPKFWVSRPFATSSQGSLPLLS